VRTFCCLTPVKREVSIQQTVLELAPPGHTCYQVNFAEAIDFIFTTAYYPRISLLQLSSWKIMAS